MAKFSIIAAMDRNRVLGQNNDIPWHIPHDLKRFKQITSGHTVIMGRKTFESLPGPLPKRRNIVITSREDYSPPGVEVVKSIEDSIKIADKKQENFVAGGANIYEQFLPFADKLYLTFIDAAYEGDTYFPVIDLSQWYLMEEEHHVTDDDKQIPFRYKTYQRK
ncbi:MAG: dihydrofolate reductase [Bacteroidales bacterium]|nr:dihydrofolate reductase [Bacteroidales bacterium]MCF8334201.1 dihydrofolate reductase [Bacteroidales bacterium]